MSEGNTEIKTEPFDDSNAVQIYYTSPINKHSQYRTVSPISGSLRVDRLRINDPPEWLISVYDHDVNCVRVVSLRAITGWMHAERDENGKLITARTI